MIIARKNGTDTNYRTMTDFQGFILYLGDAGADEYHYNYDAWGRARNATDLSYIQSDVGPAWMNRGYTGHEHMDDFQLINMYGQLYDPVIGRMLSPDNNIQDP